MRPVGIIGVQLVVGSIPALGLANNVFRVAGPNSLSGKLSISTQFPGLKLGRCCFWTTLFVAFNRAFHGGYGDQERCHPTAAERSPATEFQRA